MEEVEKLKAELKQLQLARDYEVQRLQGMVAYLRTTRAPHHDVREFQLKFGWYLPTTPTLVGDELASQRVDLIAEELRELDVAITIGDLAGQADALIDLVYVCFGFANLLGLGNVWQELWDDVQRANMSKERGVGKRGHAHDVVKPPGWVGPRTEQILAKYAERVDHLLAGYAHAPSPRAMELVAEDEIVGPLVAEAVLPRQLDVRRVRLCAVSVETTDAVLGGGLATCNATVLDTPSGPRCENGHDNPPMID